MMQNNYTPKKDCTGFITETVFLKSLSDAKETRQAMECRLFDGNYISSKSGIKPEDFLLLLICIFYLILYIFIS